MSLLIFLFGLVLAIFSHPKVMNAVMTRLFNEGIATPKNYPTEKIEIIKYGGKNLGLFTVGIVLMLIAITLRNP